MWVTPDRSSGRAIVGRGCKEFGFLCLGRAQDRLCLFEIYCTLIVDWGVEEEELRKAIRLDKLEEMLLRRCGQINDPEIFPDAAMPRNGWKA